MLICGITCVSHVDVLEISGPSGPMTRGHLLEADELMTAPYPGRAMTTVEEISAVEPAAEATAATRLATGRFGPMAVVAALRRFH